MLSALRHRLRRAPRRIGYFWAPRLASALRKRWVLIRNPHARIEFGRGSYLGPGFSLHIPDGGTFIAGPGAEFRRNFRAEVAGDGRLVVGANSVCTYNVVIQCTTSIEIGERCMLAHAVMVVDGSHRFRDHDRPILEQGYDYTPIKVGDDVAVMAHATIISDVNERAFVGANAVVTRPVPPYTVAVGVPARVTEYFGPEGMVPEEIVEAHSEPE